MSDEHQTEWNWGPAVRRRLARIEKALHASIGPDARFESGAGRQAGRDEAFVDGGDAFEQPGEDDVLGYGGASSGEEEAWRQEAYNSVDDLSKERAGRLKPSKRGLETLQSIVAALTQLTPEDSSSATRTESPRGGEPAKPVTPDFDVPEGFLLEANPAVDEPSENSGVDALEPQAQREDDASGHAPLDFEEMLKLIEELQKQPREDPGEQPNNT